jgi:hypothetical protein
MATRLLFCVLTRIILLSIIVEIILTIVEVPGYCSEFGGAGCGERQWEFAGMQLFIVLLFTALIYSGAKILRPSKLFT